MDPCILLAVEMNFSSPTQHALAVVSEVLKAFPPHVRLLVLTVIPVLTETFPSYGKARGPLRPFPPTAQERLQAVCTLRKAATALQQQGIASDRIELRLRAGAPAEEVVKMAHEFPVLFIVIGSRGESWKHRLRRALTGSVSRRVLQLAPCPVMVVVLPQALPAHQLVDWYQQAVARYLKASPGPLSTFTVPQVASQFVPARCQRAGCKEMAAAAQALENLVGTGLLCRHEGKDEVWYSND